MTIERNTFNQQQKTWMKTIHHEHILDGKTNAGSAPIGF